MNKKQVISILLLFALALPLASCATQPSGSAQTSDNAPETTVAPETTAPDVTTKAPDVTNTPVTSEPVHVHSFGEWTETKKATCTEEGAKERACSCGEKEVLAVAKTTHTEVIDAAVEATCTTTGLTEGKHCSVCKEVLIKQETVPVKAHTVVVDAYVPSTCIKAGLSEGSHCSVCNKVIVAQQSLPLGSHTYDNADDEYCNVCNYHRDVACKHTQTTKIPAVQATCQQGGLTEGKKCSKCGEILVQQVPTAPKSHRAVTIPAVQATCTTPGFTAGQKCGDCGYIIVAPQPVNPLGHNSDITLPGVEPTYENTGLGEGKKCSRCGEIVVPQPILPKLPTMKHTVTYRDDQITHQKWVDEFAEHIGVDPLRKVSIEGYEFLGWYTKPEGGDLVTNITKNTKEDVTLYAHWKAYSYSITYKDAPVNSNPTSYTIENDITLADPEWYGLRFIRWTDADGNEVTKINKGTIGNITLYANWLYEENLAFPVEANTQKGNWFNNNTGKYYFVYELGRIENIVLKVIDSDDKKKGEPLTWDRSETVTVDNSIAIAVANTITTSVSSTTGWEETIGNEYVESTNGSFNGGWNFIVEIGGNVGWDFSNTDKYDFSTSESTTSGSEQSDSVSSTVTYVKGTSSEVGKGVGVNADYPAGRYSYVCTGDATVYALITYDSLKGEYNVETFSILDDDLHEERLYEAPSYSTANITHSQGLNFNPSIMDEVKGYVESKYYVNYDANGGSGAMEKSEFKIGETYALPENKFARAGYTFLGWSTDKNVTTVTYTDKSSVKDITSEKGGLVTLYAVWKANTYKITYNLNDATLKTVVSCTATSKNVVFGTKTNLDVPSAAHYNFVGWFTSNGTQITDRNGKALANWNIASNTSLHARWTQKYEGYTYISTKAEFNNIRNNPSGNYLIVNHINIEGIAPIETFSGILNGGGNTISGWNYTPEKAEANTGIFRTNNGTIKYIVFQNCKITPKGRADSGDIYAGIVCGINNGILDHILVDLCSVSAEVGGWNWKSAGATSSNVGAICGQNKKTITACGSINNYIRGYAGTGQNKKWCTARVGGIVGQILSGSLTDVYSYNNTIDASAVGDSALFYQCIAKAFTGGVAGETNGSGITISQAVVCNNTHITLAKGKWDEILYATLVAEIYSSPITIVNSYGEAGEKTNEGYVLNMIGEGRVVNQGSTYKQVTSLTVAGIKNSLTGLGDKWLQDKYGYLYIRMAE